MDLTLLTTLKDKLVHDTEFSAIWTYFMDHFGESPEFMELGDGCRHEFLEAVLTQVAGQMFQREITVAEMRLIRLPEHHFIHGGVTIDGRFGNLIYFEDIHVGLIAVVMAWGGETKFARFTGRPLMTN